MSNLGIFGGSFDPIHQGHLHVARAARKLCRLERVLLMPAYQPPHKRDRTLTPAPHRLEMIRLAITGDQGLGLLEDEVLRGETSYTIDTLDRIQARCPDDRLYFIIGSDSLAELPTWYRYRDLAAAYGLITVERRTGDAARALDKIASRFAPSLLARVSRFVVTARPDPSSSTEVRRRLAEGQPADEMLPAPVLAYILGNGLYGTTPPT